MVQQITLLAIYPKKMKTFVHIKTFTRTFIAALFVIGKTWKQSKYSSVGEWLNNCSTSVLCNTAQKFKKNEVLIYATTLMDLKGISLRFF